MDYQNPSKLKRAQQYAKTQNKEGDEEVIKARYLELGGKLLNEEEGAGEMSLEEMTLPELKSFAKMNGIDLGESKTKADILAAIQEAQA